MSFSSKITSSDLTNKGVIGLPDTPGLSTSAMQNKLEETVRTVAIPKHNDLIDELENYTAADSIGAVAPTGLSGTSVQALINDLNVKKENNSSALPTTYVADTTDTFNIRKLTDTYKIAFSDLVTSIKTAIGNATTSVSGLFSDTDKTKLDGIEPGAQVNTVDSVNSMTGAVVLTASDVGALPDGTVVPTKTSDLTNDSNFATTSDVASAVATKSNVAWNQQITTGQKIAVVTIDGTPTDVYAPTGGGGGGGGAVDSVNGQTGTVILGVNDINDVTISSVAANDVLIRDASGWKNGQLADVAYSNDYTDLSNVPTNVSAFTNDSGYQTASDVATAISGKEDKSALKDLAYIAKDGVGSVKFLQGDGTWQNPPAGGHTMIANNTAIATMKTNSQDPTDDKVASTYAISNWSNAEIITLYTTIAKDTDTVGAWNDNWKTDGIRTGWLWHSLLHDILSDDEVEIELAFDVSGEEVVSLYAYRVDDDVQNSGVDGGAIAIKLNGAIQNASGVKVAINLKRQRTQTDNLTVLS